MKFFKQTFIISILAINFSFASEVTVFDFTETELSQLQVRKVRGADNKTIYSVGKNENGNFLKSEANNAASGLGKEIIIDLNKTPFINITWKIEQDLNGSIEGKHVLLLEGLVISGRTPNYLFNFFKLRNPASLKLCAIGLKKKKIEVELKIDYHMFDFQDEWIEGYGIGGADTKCLPYLIDIRE